MTTAIRQILFQMIPLIGVLALPIAVVIGPRSDGIRAIPVVEFAFAGDPRPVDLPTAIAIGPDQAVFLLDGVHDRVLVFEPDGRLRGILSKFGNETLNQPVGLRIDDVGRLWIADSGNGRLILAERDGELMKTIAVPKAADAQRADPTDIAFSSGGQSVWVVDNDSHRVLKLSVAENTWQVVGTFGESLGQFEFPFQIAADRSGDVFVSDVINARVQLFDRVGTPLRNFGGFGVEPGNLYRPSGVAIDGEGRLWVADAVLGVVQIFYAQGEFLDVLRDENGNPLKLSGPMGLTFDGDGALYVVEQNAHRARKFQISSGSVTALPSPQRRAAATKEPQSKACAICHIDWAPPFSDGRDSPLMTRPVATPDNPVVSRIEMCLSCHNGSIDDSRRRVWDEHGHRTGVAPPAGMSVPATLPLVDGKLGCRTCHSAHGPGVPQSDIRKAVMLRVPNTASELCVSCHSDKARGPRFGTHPTGGMPWPVPAALIEAGAKVGPNPRELTCQVCHTPHGAAYDHLLVLGTSTNQLCMNCHDVMRPGMFRDGSHAEHPLRPVLRPDQVAGVEKMGTRIGDEGRLVCLSCHKLHHGKGERFLLAAELRDGEMCLNCHAERRDMLGTAHDLRTKFPNERNRLGMTVEQGGPCSSCHLFHRFARQPMPGPGDARGQCLTCHRDGACAADKQLSDQNHPSMGCSECHNPHNTSAGHFLAKKPEELCAGCHADKTALAGGAHDAKIHGDNSCLAGGGGDRCLACHKPHARDTGTLWRIPPRNDLGDDGACLTCHSDAERHAGQKAALHPTSLPVSFVLSDKLPLSADRRGEKRIGCRTCHNPHGPPSSAGALLNVEPGETSESLCLNCHADKAAITHTAHASTKMAVTGFDAQACAPCHAMHASASATSTHLMWPELLRGVVNPDDPQVSDVYCSSCHAAGGGAMVPAAITHPLVPMFASDESASLPLYDWEGRPAAGGRIACRTCHLPHGREDAGTPVSPEVARASRPQLRPFTAPNVCTTCHATDALRRFLYFHDPQRRAPQSQ